MQIFQFVREKKLCEINFRDYEFMNSELILKQSNILIISA